MIARGISVSADVANVALDAVTRLLDGGVLCIYDGERAARPEDAVVDQRLLCEIRLQSPAFEPAEAGSAMLKPVEGRNVAAGLATWYRFKTADGKPVGDGGIGTKGASLNIGNPQLPEHALIRIERFAWSVTQIVR